jgi:hypothetical protein
MLKDQAKEFMRPHYPDNPEFPEVELAEIEGLGRNIYLSKGVISLKKRPGNFLRYVHQGSK